MTPQWDTRMMELAQQVASWSKDPGRKVGAVITRNKGRQIYTGYNGFPRLVPDEPALLEDRDRRDELTVHAELNAVLNSGHDLLAAYTIYVTEHPCDRCALLIAQVGILRVVCPAIRPDSRWADSQQLARRTFSLAQIQLDLTNFAPYTRLDVERMPREQVQAILDDVCPVTGKPHDYYPRHGHADTFKCRTPGCGYVPGRAW